MSLNANFRRLRIVIDYGSSQTIYVVKLQKLLDYFNNEKAAEYPMLRKEMQMLSSEEICCYVFTNYRFKSFLLPFLTCVYMGR